MPKTEAAFLVNAETDPVQLVVNGRACFHNAAPIKDFFDTMIQQGRSQFIIDLEECKGMDSTFLGILAGAGIELSNRDEKGQLILVHLDEKNLDTVQSLGLDQLMHVDVNAETQLTPCQYEALTAEEKSEEIQAKIALDAHKNLIKANKANGSKFQDVIQFLEERVES